MENQNEDLIKIKDAAKQFGVPQNKITYGIKMGYLTVNVTRIGRADYVSRKALKAIEGYLNRKWRRKEFWGAGHWEMFDEADEGRPDTSEWFCVAPRESFTPESLKPKSSE